MAKIVKAKAVVTVCECVVNDDGKKSFLNITINGKLTAKKAMKMFAEQNTKVIAVLSVTHEKVTYQMPIETFVKYGEKVAEND